MFNWTSIAETLAMKLFFKIIFTLLVVLLCVGVGLDFYFKSSVHKGPLSEHFDGNKFFNFYKQSSSLNDLRKLIWQSFTDKKAWPHHLELQHKPNFSTINDNKIKLSFIGHSTFVIQTRHGDLITDPIFSKRASPVQWAGPKRVIDPAVDMGELPALDTVLISHNHYDHLDEWSLKQFKDKQPLVIVGLGVKELVKSFGLNQVEELDWGQGKLISKDFKVWFLENQHRSGRAISDQMKTLWGAFAIEVDDFKIYFAGDTAYGQGRHFQKARERFGAFDLCILPIGAYEPRFFMKKVHMNPEEALKSHHDLGCIQSIATHFGSFQLTFEGINEPVEQLKKLIATGHLRDGRFDVMEVGQTRVFDY